MRYSPRNIKIAFSHAGLTHYGGILFFDEFSRILQVRRFLSRHLHFRGPLYLRIYNLKKLEG